MYINKQENKDIWNYILMENISIPKDWKIMGIKA